MGFGKDRSTVGSASATGSVPGSRATWASGSASEGGFTETTEAEGDKMSVSEDRDMEMGEFDDGEGDGMSDEGNASLVGFGEGAGSTVSGPVSSLPVGRGVPGAGPGNRSPVLASKSIGAGYIPQQSSPGSATTPSALAATQQEKRDAKMIDGMTYDSNVVDTTASRPQGIGHGRNISASGADVAERILRDRLDDGENRGGRAMGGLGEVGAGDGKGRLGRFYFEDK